MNKLIVILFIFISFHASIQLLETIDNLNKNKNNSAAALCIATLIIGLLVGIVWGYTSRLAVLSLSE